MASLSNRSMGCMQVLVCSNLLIYLFEPCLLGPYSFVNTCVLTARSAPYCGSAIVTGACICQCVTMRIMYPVTLYLPVCQLKRVLLHGNVCARLNQV